MSSISSSSLSMSSLIFLPFLASSGFAAPPSLPPSAGFVGRVSFRFCSAMSPSIGHGPCRTVQAATYVGILACRLRASRIGSRPPELFAQRQGLVLIGRTEADAVETVGPLRDALEPHLERRLTVVQHERHLASPHFHDDLGSQQIGRASC